MSGENGSNGNRRGSVTSAAFSNLFQRSNSTSAGSAMDQRRRLSVTTLGLSGNPPSANGPSFGGMRRGSISTNNSDVIDENAVDDEDSARTAPPIAPFGRRMSLGASQAMRNMRSGPGSPPTNDNAYNWSEQLRSRAESNAAAHRPSFGANGSGMTGTSPVHPNGHHDRTKSVPDLPAPPQQAASMTPKKPERPKPDAFQERILKGDFYMD